MKKFTQLFVVFLFLVSFTPIFGQKYYDDQWKKIENNYKQGLYKSNLPIILEIQKTAMKESNAVQLIKSLKAEFSIVNQTVDDPQNDASTQFFKKLSELDQSLKGEDKWIYQVLLGEFFHDYYRQNQWRINQRTYIDNQDFTKIETWSKLDFKNYLTKHFADLESNKAELQKISMDRYKAIFHRTEDLEYFPTLYEWNAVKEIDFLSNEELFTPNELKVNHPKINSVYDEVIAKNSGNSKLYFQHQKLDYNCTATKCKDRLAQLQNLYNSAPESDYKVMLIADIIDELTQKQKYTEALTWVNTAKNQYSKSKFLNNILNRENAIVNPSLTIYFETHTQPNLPIHLVADAKNVNQFSLNIYEVKSDITNFLRYVSNSYDKNFFAAVKKTLVRKESFDLQDLKDFKNHKTSLEIKPLPSGIYMAEYVVENAIQEHFYFIATNSRVIYNKKNERKISENQLKLVNRENGNSIPSEGLKLYEYSRGTAVNNFSLNTDGSAIFQLPESRDKNYYRFYLVQQPKTNDFNLIQVYGNQYYDEDYVNRSRSSAQIFLDRAIYRPGQTVYFKVINTQLLNKKESVAAGISQKISLHDANGEEISSQNFTTNEFGSYNGTFTLPTGKLNGQFSLQIHGNRVDSYKDFRVEEYKRPKFEVNFEPIKNEYKYGETIELKGKATTFSGIPLSNASVNYEIKKRNIRWMYFWWFPRGDDNENSILGEVKTNEKGEFTIKVDLKKDETLEGIQIDNYEINASVTDINGETQSAVKNVKVASVSHYITTDDIKDTFTDEPIKVQVETKNYNDQNLQKSYTAKLSKLKQPDRVLRDNFKSQIQDLPKFSKSGFIQKFPHDLYDKNDLPENWKVEKVVFDRVENQTNSNDVKQPQTLELGKLDAGTYKLELFNIEGKDTIKTEKIFDVFDRKSLAVSQKPFLKVVQPKLEFKREEKAKIYVYSAIPNSMVTVYVQNGNGETVTEQKTLKNGVLEYEVSFPKDESIDQVNVQFQLVAFNDVQTETVNLKIASDKKPLRIETVTFRDKLLPNEKEKWTVKILGDQNEKINAEVLANMYDKSLDNFAANSYYWQKLYQKLFILNNYSIRENLAQEYYSKRSRYLNQKGISFPEFNWFDGGIASSGLARITPQVETAGGIRNQSGIKDANYSAPPAPMRTMAKAEVAMDAGIDSAVSAKVAGVEIAPKENLEKIPVRQNLNETAFFYPNLMTDKDGNVNFEFTSPEALTQWKMMFLAHTKDARSAYLEKEVVTQKEFSVNPNYPRFLSEGDEINLQTKLSSLVAKSLNGYANLQILDAFTNEDITEKFGISQLTQTAGYNITNPFSLNENGNTVVNWKLRVPNDVSSIILKIVAKAGEFSDGEQKAIAVLPNRMLVTDAVPIFVKEGQTKTFVLENLAKNTSKTATNFANTLELTTNPIWEIMFALPSLKNDTNNSADVVFNKWFADVLASEIFKANPKMKTVFDEYQSKGLLTSNLEKNQELKQLLLEETPWVLQSKNETEQMEKLARIFDANTMRNSINNDWSDLVKLQNPDGGFSWYQGYPSSYYTSLYILKNLGRINEWLKGNVADYQSSDQKKMVAKLVNYVDTEVHKYWEIDKERVWNNHVLDYLDTRHYWENQYPLKGKGATLKNLVIKKAPSAKITDFTFFGLHRAAKLFDDYKLTNLSNKLMVYLKETSTQSETQGIYWKQNLNDWGWYSSKTVNHSGALEAFQKLKPNDQNFIEEMKIWLVTQKEVNSWGSSRGTAEVIYTILNSGKSWTSNDSDQATIVWGGKTLENFDKKATGYVKTSVKPENVDKNLGTVTVTKPGPGIVQGGLFWQYYEDLDKIKSTETYISITKELYRKVKTANGEELQKITPQTPLKVGDKVTVRMILNTDRNMEFIHIKDMRAAGFEPLKALSGYEWKNGLGYYQSTKDASTNFYIQYMPKGKYVFEYDYICNASGTFSNGITTLQNYYAPQMNAHTQGTRVTIAE
ncbi:MG2 domain-containing protein [Chryseobacterium suipulveris]|uniref:MG2 domain-containing protein n=1 Tax=Chryseobacterium suipulveris TaxID=2929800 RepID=A0ABY4BUW9_9FLAO|nr:MG2 domain-containing protein [Chryseobacterium suipulveris]UOE41987.1 MG2 domain-containing protein [Chryseobacterium suipulveris]